MPASPFQKARPPQSAKQFERAYSSLNTNQKLAVDTLEGPVIVMAGPGTGKTQMLTVRIANILDKTDTDPASILALTFTEAAAKEMRSRLIGLIGKAGYYVRITTFHSFCADIINENPERFSQPAGLTPASDLEKIEIITRILDEGTFLLLKPLNVPDLYLNPILSAISDLKREGITVAKFSRLVHSLSEELEVEKDSLSKTAFLEKEKLTSKNIDLLGIYKKYQDELLQSGRFDFEDMINWVVEAFEADEEFLLTYQEKFHYVLVDEYQDTNSAQNRLIFSLTSFWKDKANIFVVGDPNQSIYRFQGASLENIHFFEKQFPGAVKINLDQNYRSTSAILSSAAALVTSSPLVSNTKHKLQSIQVAKFSSSLFEDEFLIDSIRTQLESGISPSDIAIIAKENTDLDHLVNLFKKNGLPYRLEGGTDILTTPYIFQFVKIIRVVTNMSASLDDLDLFTVLNYPYFHLSPAAVLRLSRLAHQKKISLVDLLQTNDPEVDSAIKDVFGLFVAWSSAAAHETLSALFQRIFQESGLMDYLLQLPQPILELNRFGTLYDDVKKQLAKNPTLSLFDYLKNLDLMLQHGLKMPEVVLTPNLEAITLTTAHKSKGLEWLIVYVYRFADTHWGNKTHRQLIKLPSGILSSEISKDDKNDEERRLFYVALTRAKQSLFLIGSTFYSHSVKMVFPAMFLSDLPQKNLQEIDTKKYEKDAANSLVSLLSPGTPALLDEEVPLLEKLISEFKLSPTALNTYLECHYKFKLDNLYRLPRAKAPAMCFGTAVHFALENLYRQLNKTGQLPPEESFLADFETALRREVLSPNDFKERLSHGRKILIAYYSHYHDDFSPALFTEKNFGLSSSNPILLDDIALSGKSDRIDLLSHKDKTVRFVDYKTGAPKTRGILEKTGDGPEGNYKRQLVFYNLLACLDQSFGYRIAETELDFIEPDKAGHFHRERFVISNKEVDDLKQTINRSVKSIRSLDFARTQDNSVCRRCDFLSHCWPNGLPEN